MSLGRRYLFVCGKNRHRSPTAEQLFANHSRLSVMSAGLATDSDLPLDAEMLEWADRIFVMETRHRRAIAARFSPATRRVPIVGLGVRDEYRFMQPELVAILRAKMARHPP